MSEDNYRLIITEFLSRSISVDEFIAQYMFRWKADRDESAKDEKFGRLIDRLFTSCDCYAAEPTESYEITEEELRHEVSLLAFIWWDLTY